MRKLALATLALTGLGSALAAVPAHADVTNPGPGLICQFASVSDPTAEAGTQSGQISGGPLLLTDRSLPGGKAGVPGSGTLTCRIQVGVADHTGTGPSVSGHGTGVVVIAPSVINYTAAATDFVYLCGEVTDDATGTTYFWDDTNSAWSTVATVACGLADSPGSGGGDDPLKPYEDQIDAIICPVLQQSGLFGPDGDIVLPEPIGAVWDCPPYGNV